MKPPIFAEALVAATAPPNDYESIAGDLQEEYVRYARSTSISAANRWYWSQVLRSVPSLLSYSRVHRSFLHAVGIGVVVVVVLLAMLFATIPINALLEAAIGSPTRWPLVVSFFVDWTDAAAFGAVLAAIIRSGGVRLAFWAASFLVLCFALPALLGNPASQAPAFAWILLCGTVPAMCTGAALCQMVIRRRSRYLT
jgi:hypothetical protein